VRQVGWGLTMLDIPRSVPLAVLYE
jgi:hypothetical protein